MLSAHRAELVVGCGGVEKFVVVNRLCSETAGDLGHNVQSNDAEDEDDRQSHDNNGVNLETGGLISVQPQHGA